MSFRTHGAVLLIFILTVCTLVTDSRFVVLCHKNDLGIMGTIYSMATKALTMTTNWGTFDNNPDIFIWP